MRDVAAAHRLALEKEAAGGRRFLVSGGMFVWQDFCKFRGYLPILLVFI